MLVYGAKVKNAIQHCEECNLLLISFDLVDPVVPPLVVHYCISYTLYNIIASYLVNITYRPVISSLHAIALSYIARSH